MYLVNEIFYSIQGEGAFTGTPVGFVRFSGCNRKCSFCDTDFDEFTEMSAGDIVQAISEYPTPHIVLTGGEPLLQVDDTLIKALHDAGFSIHVETNGTLPVPDGIDWVTCSPKEPPLRIQPEKVNEIKVVFTGQTEDELEKLREQFPHTPLFYLQPCSGKNVLVTLMRVLITGNWRLSLQIHKILDIR